MRAVSRGAAAAALFVFIGLAGETALAQSTHIRLISGTITYQGASPVSEGTFPQGATIQLDVLPPSSGSVFLVWESDTPAFSFGVDDPFQPSTGLVVPAVAEMLIRATFDSDGDGIPTHRDNCPFASNVGQADADGDGVGDACDGCPASPLKSTPGSCGCDVADTDSDGDGTPDCVDVCRDDPGKSLAAGICGCGQPDSDSDADGTVDCLDGCPNDPFKLNGGVCGCGLADADTDGDGVPDCVDNCPSDADVDTDGDGLLNCVDGCPTDPAKSDPGLCGCGVTDTNKDGDGTPDCGDICSSDPLKVLPGKCGCGTPDTDTDGDHVADCSDACPQDSAKAVPGVCGCGRADVDANGDGSIDCLTLDPDAGQQAPAIDEQDDQKIGRIWFLGNCGLGTLPAMCLVLIGLTAMRARRR